MSQLLILLSLLLPISSGEIPLGCMEDENPIRLNYPFFTIPVGKKVMYNEKCDKKHYLSQKLLDEISPLNGFTGLKKESSSVVLNKDRQSIKRFYTTSNLTPYYGIKITKAKLNIINKIMIALEREYGDGLFLLVLRNDNGMFARQIIVDEIKCAVEVIIPVAEFFQIPYKEGDFLDAEYQIELYLINYNKMKWKFVGFEIE
ncbi:MAG: hypothetical protein ACP5QK_08235 [Myxococcota bacterium]